MNRLAASGPMEPAALGFRVRRFDRLASTQATMRALLEAGEDVDGLVIRTVEQTAGHGRRGTPWSGALGGSYQTIALREADGGKAGAPAAPITLGVAVGIAETLHDLGAKVRIKWPNDLYLRGRKLGGILTERARGHYLIGVGINVDNEPPEGAVGLAGRDLEAVHTAVLRGVQVGREAVADGSSFVERYASLDLLAGARVHLRTAAGALEGEAAGIDAQGRLCVLDATTGAATFVSEGRIASWSLTERGGGRPA